MLVSDLVEIPCRQAMREFVMPAEAGIQVRPPIEHGNNLDFPRGRMADLPQGGKDDGSICDFFNELL